MISAYTREVDASLRRQVARVISKPFYFSQMIGAAAPKRSPFYPSAGGQRTSVGTSVSGCPGGIQRRSIDFEPACWK